MKARYIANLLDVDKMKVTLRTRGNLSAPGLDGVTNPILKIERNSTANTMIEVMKVLLNSGYCPSEWKGARTILIHKGNDRDNPGNWRPITINSVLYRVIFCRLVEGLHTVHEEGEINLCDKEQKGFVSRRAACVEHEAVVNALINEAVQKRTPIYVLSFDWWGVAAIITSPWDILLAHA
jgi:hypothetical protein